jgi:hypothetical protein
MQYSREQEVVLYDSNAIVVPGWTMEAMPELNHIHFKCQSLELECAHM